MSLKDIPPETIKTMAWLGRQAVDASLAQAGTSASGVLDCRSEEGVTVGLIDSLISIGRVLSNRDLVGNYHVKEALKDFLLDSDMRLILAAAREAMDEERGQPIKGNGYDHV